MCIRDRAHHRELAFHHGAILVGGGDDVELAVGLHEPGPAGAEARGRRLGELLLEPVEAAERGCDGLGYVADRRSTGARGHDLPEHRMVNETAAVIPYR